MANRERHIPAAEMFADGLHKGDNSEAGRAKWNRAFHTAMQTLVDGRTPTATEVSYDNLWTTARA